MREPGAGRKADLAKKLIEFLKVDALVAVNKFYTVGRERFVRLCNLWRCQHVHELHCQASLVWADAIICRRRCNCGGSRQEVIAGLETERC